MNFMVTTDIDNWLTTVLKSGEDKESLISCIKSNLSIGNFKININENKPIRYFITPLDHSSTILMINDETKEYLLDRLNNI